MNLHPPAVVVETHAHAARQATAATLAIPTFPVAVEGACAVVLLLGSAARRAIQYNLVVVARLQMGCVLVRMNTAALAVAATPRHHAHASG